MPAFRGFILKGEAIGEQISERRRESHAVHQVLTFNAVKQIGLLRENAAPHQKKTILAAGFMPGQNFLPRAGAAPQRQQAPVRRNPRSPSRPK